MGDAFKGMLASKKWQAIFGAIATVWIGVLAGQATPREGLIATVVLLLGGVGAQATADAGKSKALIEAEAARLQAELAGLSPTERAAKLAKG